MTTRTTEAEATRIKVKLTETDGNAFALISRVHNALIIAGQKDQALAFMVDAANAGSYHDLLDLFTLYADIS